MRIADLIRERQDEIITEWAKQARERPTSRSLDALARLDRAPLLLQGLAECLEKAESEAHEPLRAEAMRRVADRLPRDFDLAEVVDEYGDLRAVLLELAHRGGPLDISELAKVNAAIDGAISASVKQYVRERERRAREDSTRVRLALQASGVGTWEWLPTEDRLEWDARTHAIFGVPEGPSLRFASLLEAVHPDDRPELAALAGDRLARADDFHRECRVLARGEERWARVDGNVIERDAQGRAARAVGTVLDVTEQRRARERERTATRELEAYAGIGSALVDAENVQQLLVRILEVFLASSPSVDAATILIREGDELRVRAAVGLEAARPEPYSVPMGEGFAGIVAATRSPMLVRDAAQSELVTIEWIRRAGIRALYGVPLVNEGQLVGVAHIASRSADDFSDDEKRLFLAAADRAASAIVVRALRDAMARRNAELEAILRAVPDAMLITDRQRVTFANEAAAQLLGVAHASDLHRPLTEIFGRLRVSDAQTGEPVPEDQRIVTRALRGERAAVPMVLTQLETGRERYARVAGAPIWKNDEVIGTVAICTDTTALVELERQRDAFMHAIVHDLRNPLTSIVTVARLVARRIERDDGDRWGVDRLHTIEANARRLNRLLSDLLDIVLARSGHLAFKSAPLRLSDLLEEQVAIWAPTTSRHELRVQACHAIVIADRDRVTQVLDNLLSNAIKYSSQGGPIEVTCSIEGREACVSVRDHGIGIPREKQRAIFQPYVRVSDGAGHGLGLFITSEIVRQQGGRIGVESELGQGARFWFTLPLAESTRPRARGE